MHIELALFDGDILLERGEVHVGVQQQVSTLALFQVTHRLGHETADVVLSDFQSPHTELIKITMDVPIHTSTDWETLDLGRYTLAFWCRQCT